MLQKFPATKLLEEDEDIERKRKQEREEKVTKNLISSSLLLVYIKQDKVKDIFDFGGNYPNVAPLLPTL